MGELESSLRRDAERLKGIITRDRDVVRIPYAAADSEWPRRMVMMASANGSDFLNDPTGSTRWGIIPVLEVDYEHDVDMQQLFSQLAVDFRKGTPWWLPPELETELEEWNARHQATSIVRDAVFSVIDMDGDDTVRQQRLTASDVLRLAAFEHPTQAQARECGAILRARFGAPTKSKQGMRWNLPVRPYSSEEDDEPRPQRTPGKSKFD